MNKTDSSSLPGLILSWFSDKAVWIGAVMVGLVVVYIEFGRRQAVAVPIPFLILLGVVVLVGSLCGKRSGIAGAVVSSLYIFYSTAIGFGPATLTGGILQAILGSVLMVTVGYLLGRTRDQNTALIGALEQSQLALEVRVEARTAELSQTNEQLRREIRERLEAEAALHNRDIYFQRLIENALDIVTVLNQDGTIRFESPSIKRVLGYAPDELIGLNAFDFIHLDDIEMVIKEFERALIQSSHPRTIEFRFRHKNGTWRILETIGSNLLADPIVAGLIINSRDITNRREIEKQAQRQNSLAMVGQLAAGIAHDFNNIMSVILLYAQILIKSPNLTPKEKDRIQTIYNEGFRAAALTAQILDFGRQTVLDPKPIDLLPLLEDFVVLLRRTLAGKIEVDLTYEKDSYIVWADWNRLQQALMNLALNSRDAMPDGGLLRIDLTKIEQGSEEASLVGGPEPGGWVKLTVIDNGIGISQEGMKHLFEPFFTTKEPGKGTGLGLPQVYGIVKQHNGFVDVDTEVGRGTSFGIILPKEDVEQLGKPSYAPDVVIAGNQERLLIVEDNDATQMAMMVALEALNYKIFSVRNGLEALTMLERHPEVDLVISDVVMPEMGGVALFEAMEAQGISTPLFLLTGDTMTEEMERVKSEGRVEYFSKPIPIEMLSKVIDRYLNS